jgi:aminoethylphosphonate catabolism LysR family transcriptional regulator
MSHVELRAFHVVASEGSFTRAAATLRVTQPTLSMQVRALEERYGVALFDRRGRGVVPTPLGAQLLALTRRLFLVESEADELLARAHGLLTGQLRVGADGPYHVVAFLAAFRQRHPDVHVALQIGNSDDLLEQLHGYRTDVAVAADIADDERLERVPCGVHRLVLLLPRRHKWSRRRTLSIHELNDQPMVLREPGSRTRALFEAALAEAGVAVRPVMEIESREAVREAVAAGLGIGIVSEAEFGNDDRLTTVAIPDAKLEMREYVVCLKVRRRLRIVSAFFDEVMRGVAAEFQPSADDGEKHRYIQI